MQAIFTPMDSREIRLEIQPAKDKDGFHVYLRIDAHNHIHIRDISRWALDQMRFTLQVALEDWEKPAHDAIRILPRPETPPGGTLKAS